MHAMKAVRACVFWLLLVALSAPPMTAGASVDGDGDVGQKLIANGDLANPEAIDGTPIPDGDPELTPHNGSDSGAVDLLATANANGSGSHGPIGNGTSGVPDCRASPLLTHPCREYCNWCVRARGEKIGDHTLPSRTSATRLV